MDQHIIGSELGREINVRAGDRRGLGESGVSETLGDGGSQETVMLLRLIGESEESEEEDSTNDRSPTLNLQWGGTKRSQVDEGPRELEDAGVSPVGVIPRDPWTDHTPHGVCDNIPGCKREGEAKIGGSQSDEAPVAAVSHVASGSKDIPELLSPLQEDTDCEDWR